MEPIDEEFPLETVEPKDELMEVVVDNIPVEVSVVDFNENPERFFDEVRQARLEASFIDPDTYSREYKDYDHMTSESDYEVE